MSSYRIVTKHNHNTVIIAGAVEMILLRAHSLLFILLCSFLNYSSPSPQNYFVKCSVSYGEQQFDIESCVSALFSPSSFDTSSVISTPLSTFGCDFDSLSADISSKNSIKVVNRGQCTFEQKTRVALDERYKGLVILDSEIPKFPVGSANSSFLSEIPVVLISKAAVDAILSNAGSYPIRLHLFRPEPWKSNKLPQLHQQLLEHIPVLKIELLVCLTFSVFAAAYFMWQNICFVQGASLKSRISFISRVSFWILSFGVLTMVFVTSRIGTIRRFQFPKVHESAGFQYPLLSGFHHIETDELIFESLIRSVHIDPTDYTLQGKPILSILKLPKENYDHPLFIHPPNFVYFSSFLHYFANIPLPLIPIVLQVLTLLCIPWLISSLVSSLSPSMFDYPFILRVSVRAGWLFMICPLTWFCSQKVWIDNALMFACVLALTVHVCLTPRCSYNTEEKLCNPSLFSRIVSHCVSGLVYGAVALNTKITALAVLPVLLLWTIWQGLMTATLVRQHFQRQYNHKKDDDFDDRVHDTERNTTTSKGEFFVVIVSTITFLVSAVAAHLPWMLWYQSKTGRWLPSAWPSVTMIAQSAFVRKAVTMRSWYFYLQQSCTVMPLFFIAITIGSLVGIIYGNVSFKQVTNSDLVREKRVGLCGVIGFVVSYIWIFLLGMTTLGMLGAGFQTRFLLPCSPLVAIAVSFILELFSIQDATPSPDATSSVYQIVHVFAEQFIYLAILVSAITGWYYGVQFPTKFADLDGGGVFEFLASILSTAMDQDTIELLQSLPERYEALQRTLQYHGFHQ